MINTDFDLALIYTLNRVPEAEQRVVFDKFGPESGRAFFELFFWMLDESGATVVDSARYYPSGVLSHLPVPTNP